MYKLILWHQIQGFKNRLTTFNSCFCLILIKSLQFYKRDIELDISVYRVSALNLPIFMEVIEEVQTSKKLYGGGGSKMHPWGVREGRKLVAVVSKKKFSRLNGTP